MVLVSTAFLQVKSSGNRRRGKSSLAACQSNVTYQLSAVLLVVVVGEVNKSSLRRKRRRSGVIHLIGHDEMSSRRIAGRRLISFGRRQTEEQHTRRKANILLARSTVSGVYFVCKVHAGLARTVD